MMSESIENILNREIAEEARIARQEAAHEAMIDRARMREREGE